MPKLSPRLGYYIVSLGTVIQFLGLTGDSWLSNSSRSSSGAGTLSFTHPGDVLLVTGMAVTVLGVILGFFSLADSIPNEAGRTPRLLPVLPLVLLVGLSIGSVAFAYQAGSNASNAVGVASASPDAVTPFVVATPGPETCPEGTVWHPVMGHCMTPEAIAALQNAKCPEGYALDPNLLTCLASTAGPQAPSSTGTATSTNTTVCPIGFFWHPAMNHCMETSSVVCPAGYQWSTTTLACTAAASEGTITSEGTTTPAPNETPACPNGTFWHPVMSHCMTVCPAGFEWSDSALNCLQVALPTATPLPSGTPVPTTTPTPTGTPPPACPDGFFWHPDMGHCMSTTCPSGLVFDPVTLYCLLPDTTLVPTTTPTPTGTPPPACPDGFFWHPDMGHCMSNTCPPGLVFDPVTLYCLLPDSVSSPAPTAAPTATPTPEPSCPDGFFWHPDMGHCMSYTCPPGLIFDPGTLYCVLPDS